jgi:hypothetical protein
MRSDLPFQGSLVVLLAALFLLGCGGKKPRKEQPEERPRNPLLGNPQPGAGGIRRAVDRPKVLTDLKTLADLYNAYLTEFGRPPNSVEAFKQYIQRDAGRLAKALEEGAYVLVLVRMPNSNVVLAYEKTADANGFHQVAKGDGSVSPMTSAQLQQALNNPQ